MAESGAHSSTSGSPGSMHDGVCHRDRRSIDSSHRLGPFKDGHNTTQDSGQGLSYAPTRFFI